MNSREIVGKSSNLLFVAELLKAEESTIQVLQTLQKRKQNSNLTKNEYQHIISHLDRPYVGGGPVL